ncbi:MAG: UDP-N-acetylmuramyl-tripeptide synthetase, partial [Planctomycetes bacterium]|nr:UDP-N-acetylmuramyl-tripeptide synthetase [Planctomycetota bacterium]
DIDGTLCRIEFEGQRATVTTSLTGRHNVSNILAAAGLCLAAGIDLNTTAKGLSAMKCVPGRLEKVNCGQDFAVLVDYAHTDDALKNVLGTLRPLCKGKLAVVFGCGGDRDRTKRPRMAKAAERLADRVIVTSDNPRTEDADGIIADVMAGFAEPGNVTVEVDRKRAIQAAIKGASTDDIILIAGKGHEDYQIIGDERLHFDDVEVATEILKGSQ